MAKSKKTLVQKLHDDLQGKQPMKEYSKNFREMMKKYKCSKPKLRAAVDTVVAMFRSEANQAAAAKKTVKEREAQKAAIKKSAKESSKKSLPSKKKKSGGTPKKSSSKTSKK